MRILGSLLFFAAATVATAVAASACSSSTSDSSSAETCASSPFSCPAGETCSAKDATGAFACIKSGNGTKGSACINTPGMTTCGDGLTCLQVVQSGGQCTNYCEVGSTTHGCASTETCTAAGIQGTSTIFHVCTGGAPAAADAGSKDAATAADAATD
jgi:hypothetical protein